MAAIIRMQKLQEKQAKEEAPKGGLGQVQLKKPKEIPKEQDNAPKGELKTKGKLGNAFGVILKKREETKQNAEESKKQKEVPLQNVFKDFKPNI